MINLTTGKWISKKKYTINIIREGLLWLAAVIAEHYRCVAAKTIVFSSE
jgi:hypothetical protein